MAKRGVKSTTMVHEMVMMLCFSPSCVATRTTGPDSIRVKALLICIFFMTVCACERFAYRKVLGAGCLAAYAKKVSQQLCQLSFF